MTSTETLPPETVPVADLPSGDPIPSGINPGADAKSSPSLRPTLAALLAATPSRLDAFLAHLNRCFATPSGIDTVLLFVCYTSRLSSSALAALAGSLLRRRARDWAALIVTLPPRTAVFFGPSAAGGNPSKKGGASSAAAAAVLSALSARLRALSALASEVRTTLRLWALLGMYFWGRGLVLKTLATIRARRAARQQQEKSDDNSVSLAAAAEFNALDTVIAYLQLTFCVGFQTLENGSYLSSKGVLPWSPATQARASRWASRLWGAHVGLELGRLVAERVGRVPPKTSGADGKDYDAWRRALARNAAWFPLTIHWGREGGFVSDWMVGALACVPAVIQIRQLWKETA